MEVTAEHTIPGKGVWLMVAINMWQPEQAATMFHAAALRRGPAAQWSNEWLAASVAMLHGGLWAWCCVIVALEPRSLAL